MIALASDVILRENRLQPHFGQDFTIDFDPKRWVYIASGKLPGVASIETLRRRLRDIESAGVDTEALTVDRSA